MSDSCSGNPDRAAGPGCLGGPTDPSATTGHDPAGLTTDAILNSMVDGVFAVDDQWRIIYFNPAAEKLTGMTRAEVLGKRCSEVFQADICGEDCAVAASMYTGHPQANRCISIKNVEGESVPVSICAAPLHDRQGNLIGGVETLRDLRMVNGRKGPRLKRHKCGEIISNSPAMRRIFEILPPIAASRSNVLITGESGTGKELVARAIHNLSGNKNGPFVAVNCGALPDTLLEAELFGYKAGAFTDAKQDRAGRFAAASGGTLLLDEIGDVPQPVQVKLLRVIETKLYEPLGSNVSVPTNVRIVAATNHDLKSLVMQGRFRDDLFYRLNVANLYLPPLRERPEDIPLLIEHFINGFNADRGKDIGGLADEAMRLLLQHDFPGNIRELQNVIEYAFILCPGGLIQPGHLPEPFASKTVDGRENQAELPPASHSLTMEEIEKRAILESLKRNEWRRMATCRELDISKDTLRRKIERYGIEEEGTWN